jgi:acetyl-CoA/propionyl-CoA carboxylase biotin carboxyl carrier protein
VADVLIANRGEIAVRIASTVHKLGLRSAAIFTPADEAAVHAGKADVAVAVDSYLDRDSILAAAARIGARFIHPGYGFLSENADFASTVEARGFRWVGPPADAIELMGDKARSKAAARTAGVPVVPGVDGDDVSIEDIRTFCREQGYPVVIKAVAGGGGKGMRVVFDKDGIEPGLAAARREAESAFGDGRVLVERYLERPRHIEIQILADEHGTCVHLGERECSLQRRHQKVIEEAPSPGVGAALRERMGTAAVALATYCGYTGAGTVEFIVPAEFDSFYFLEMNTRLQVEHPVTEAIYGVDLVEQQLRVARGERLELTAEQLAPAGHAIEARIYAEDPRNGFLPATGVIRRYREPVGTGVRIDAGIETGTEIVTDYDPMLAKVIAHGRDRTEAIGRLDRALAALVLLGPATNVAFSRHLLGLPDVAAGRLDTGLLERELERVSFEVPEDLWLAAAAAVWRRDVAGIGAPSAWLRTFEDFGDVRISDGHIAWGNTSRTFSCRALDEERIQIVVDGVSRIYQALLSGDEVCVARDGHHLLARSARSTSGEEVASDGGLESPLPGVVLNVNVVDGDRVRAGDVLVIIESMKMELQITAPGEGTIANLALRAGDRVRQGQTLLTLEQ